MKNLPLFVAACILSLGIGYNVRVSNFKVINVWGDRVKLQTGCMKGITYLFKRIPPLPRKVRHGVVYYCNELDVNSK